MRLRSNSGDLREVGDRKKEGCCPAVSAMRDSNDIFTPTFENCRLVYAFQTFTSYDILP